MSVRDGTSPEKINGAEVRLKLKLLWNHDILSKIRPELNQAELICSMEDGALTSDLFYALYLSERMQTRVAVLPAQKTG